MKALVGVLSCDRQSSKHREALPCGVELIGYPGASAN